MAVGGNRSSKNRHHARGHRNRHDGHHSLQSGGDLSQVPEGVQIKRRAAEGVPREEEEVKRKRPKDIVDKQTWRVARIATQIWLGHEDKTIPEAVKAAIDLIDEAQRQVDKDVSKGAEKSGL